MTDEQFGTITALLREIDSKFVGVNRRLAEIEKTLADQKYAVEGKK
jgi:hypothetical protein